MVWCPTRPASALTTSGFCSPLELSGVLSLLFEAREDSALVVPEVDRQFDELVGTVDVGDGLDRSYANVDLLELVVQNLGFHGCGFERVPAQG